jgi:dihydrofolate reductase
MIISLIVAASRNNVIGRANQLPWHLPNDMKFFKGTTWAMPVIMGRKTFESMGAKPLPGRHQVVISRNNETQNTTTGIIPATSIEDALQKAESTGCREVFIAGGGEIYRQLMPKAHRIYMTRVDIEMEGDTFFPEIDENTWTRKSAIQFRQDEKHLYDFSIEVWEPS